MKGSGHITHRERIKSLTSHQPLDRIPIAFWRHFPVDDQEPQSLATATIHFQKTYDFDLVKVTPASSFCLKDWGSEDRWEGNPEGTRFYSKRVIQSPQDWERLPILDPSTGYLAKQLKCLALIHDQLDEDTPILQTIFSPLAQAKNLAGNDLLLVHLRNHPDEVYRGLEIIAQSIQLFIKAAIQTGTIDGIFYAIQHAQAQFLTENEFMKFGRQLDLSILKNAQGLWCNMVHLHGTNVYFNQVVDYPVDMINWHDRDTLPSLKQASSIYPGIICGGLKRETITLGSRTAIEFEMKEAVTQVNGKRLLFGSGCVLPVIAPHGNILAARQFVEQI